MAEQLEKLTLSCLLENTFGKYSSRPALSFIDNKPYTYREIKEKLLGISGFLKANGISKGDRVAILGENHPHWGIAFFAITSIGAIAVPVMHEFTPNEIGNILHHSEARAIFISSKLLNRIENANNSSSLLFRILLDDFSVRFLNRNEDIGRIDEICNSDLNTPHPSSYLPDRQTFPKDEGTGQSIYCVDIQEDDPASLIYTSGTSGHSKGVVLTHKNLVSDADACDRVVDVIPDDKLLSILPLSHTTECTLGLILPVMKGASIYYLEKPPAASSLLPALDKVKPTIMLSVPLVIEKIYRTKIITKINDSSILRTAYKIPPLRKKINIKAGKKLLDTFGGNLKMVCIGGAPVAEDVEKFLCEARFPYTVGYGLTETSPLITASLPKDFKFRSTGKILSPVNVKIDNPDPNTGIGEILVKGPNVMKEYYKDPERTKEVFTNDGWLRTGDLGYRDKDNYLFVKGRIKNVIIGANGKNIYPEELEALINECEYVVESLVLNKENHLIAKVHLDYEKLENIFPNLRSIESEIKREIKVVLENIRTNVNKRVASFSKISKIDEQTVPFEKTPTRKIKRYLYD